MRDRLVTIAGSAGAAILAWNTVAVARHPAAGQLVFFYAPMTIAALLCAIVSVTASVALLATRNFRYDSLSVAAVEVGLAMLAGSLGAGAVWARAIGGMWWDWNAPLTSALACGLLYTGHLILRHAVEEPTRRATFSAVFSIFAFVDIAAVLFAVDWWTAKHPRPVMWEGLQWTPGVQMALLGNAAGVLLLGIALVAERTRQEESQREVDALRRRAHAF